MVVFHNNLSQTILHHIVGKLLEIFNRIKFVLNQPLVDYRIKIRQIKCTNQLEHNIVISNLGEMECTQKVERIKEKLGRIVMKERKIFFIRRLHI
jgi:hypothetical protein